VHLQCCLLLLTELSQEVKSEQENNRDCEELPKNRSSPMCHAFSDILATSSPFQVATAPIELVRHSSRMVRLETSPLHEELWTKLR
jgi:hypothetical protein